VKIPVGYVGGVLSIDDMEQVIQEGFGFVEVGRATIQDPSFVDKLRREEIRESACDHCNRCIAAMDAGGVYCVSNEKGFVYR